MFEAYYTEITTATRPSTVNTVKMVKAVIYIDTASISLAIIAATNLFFFS